MIFSNTSVMATERNIFPNYFERLKILHIFKTKYSVVLMKIKVTVIRGGLNYTTFLLCNLYRPVLSVHDSFKFITHYIFPCDDNSSTIASIILLMAIYEPALKLFFII